MNRAACPGPFGDQRIRAAAFAFAALIGIKLQIDDESRTGHALVDLFLQLRNWPFGAAVSVALVAIMFATIVIYMRFVPKGAAGERAALV